MRNDKEYLPIEDYAMIGNLRTVALIGRNGSMDWCCLPEMDSPSVFAALLDSRKGGAFRVRAAGGGGRVGAQRYLEGTNVLRTTLDGSDGRVVITDFMPVRGELEDAENVESPKEIHRLLSCEEGDEVAVEVEWAPRFDYARADTRLTVEHGRVRASGGSPELVLAGLPEGSIEIGKDEGGPVLRSRFALRSGEPRALVLHYGDGAEGGGAQRERSLELCEETAQAWRDWVHVCDPEHPCGFTGTLHEEAVRSALAMKLLTYAPTGAIAAAPTTSLPEDIGGVRNWDYRYTWVRDSALISQSLFGMGHGTEAKRFLKWLEEVAAHEEKEGYDLQIMYSLRGGHDLDEHELPHLEGYRGSSPVRIGNGAADQLQLDVYGELINSAFELTRIGGEITPELWTFLASLADEACQLWQEPDKGFWEIRLEPKHYVSSKVMVWTGLDRAIRMAEGYGWQGNVAKWRRSREAIRKAVLEHGYDRESGSFVRDFDSTELDASNLLIPLVEFLPAKDPRMQGTIDRTMRELGTDGLIHRYLADDGLPGDEGAFVLCTFWMVDALTLSGRRDEAQEVFDTAFDCRNHVGLLPEEIDPESRAFLGNFPQAFSQAGLINSAMYMAAADDKGFARVPLIGTREHREETVGVPGGSGHE